MTAARVPQQHALSAQHQANAWLIDHHGELKSRASACYAHFTPELREEAVAEAVANATDAAHSAARRGTLHRLTPFHCVAYAVKHFRQGRRIAGSSSTDALAEATRVKHGVQVVSLDQDRNESELRPSKLRESLADRDAEDPGEVVRRAHDYPLMLGRASVSEKARGTFMFLAEHHGEGKQTDLAARLLISPGRITQLKRELADVLSRHNYRGPLGPRPASA